MPFPSVGEKIPAVELQDLDGNTTSLDRWLGKPLVLVFLREPG